MHTESNLSDVVKLGFSTLFLNRTNRSGILKGGVIGGLSQNGEYSIGCRFNKPDLTRKIKRISLHRPQINLSRLDAVSFIKDVIPTAGEKTLVNLDPPYFKKGPGLYTNFYQPEDHAELADAVSIITKHWMVTYDDTPEIRGLYSRYPMYIYGLNYSAQLKRVGTELLVLDPTLRIPSTMRASPVVGEFDTAEANHLAG